jgi:carbonic anhydrase
MGEETRVRGELAHGMTRRGFVRLAAAGAGGALVGLGTLIRPVGVAAADPTPDQALQQLVQGNARFVGGKVTRPNQTAKRRGEVAKGQRPFAAILSCSDSRVPPEVVFDQGLGDLFVVRVAGNVADDPGIGSLEYAVAVLGAPLVMVLGHSACGAVDATLKGGEFPGRVGSIAKLIAPAVEKAKGQPGNTLANAIHANVALTVDRLKTTTPILSDAVEKKKIRIVGAHYDLASGRVELLG